MVPVDFCSGPITIITPATHKQCHAGRCVPAKLKLIDPIWNDGRQRSLSFCIDKETEVMKITTIVMATVLAISLGCAFAAGAGTPGTAPGWGGWEGRQLYWWEGRRSPRYGRSRRGCTQRNTGYNHGHGNRHHIRRTGYSGLKCKRPLQWGLVNDRRRGLLN